MLRNLLSIVGLCALASASRYNILSLESAEYKGYLTATFIDYIERNAYNVAVRDYCLPERDTQRIAMPEIFDMIAGSETGAIIATSLVIPNKDKERAKVGQKNQFYASESQKWFKENTDKLYHNSGKFESFGYTIGFIVSVIISIVTNVIVDKNFEAKDFDDIVTGLRFLIKIEKKIAKGQYFDRDDTQPQVDGYIQLIDSQTSHIYVQIQNLLKRINAIKDSTSSDQYKLDELYEIEATLEDVVDQIYTKEGLKNLAGIVAFTVSLFVIQGWVVPQVVYYSFSLKNAEILGKSIVNDHFIRDGLNIKDIVSDDLFITAWDVNHQNPRFFNQWSAQNEVQKNFNHDLTLGEMTWTSATTPKYFMPVTVKGELYTSGDNVAQNPAFYAYLYANERKETDGIRVVSIGSINTEAEAINADVGLLRWAKRLAKLAEPARKHAQDYMLDAIMRRNGDVHHVFEVEKSNHYVNDLEKSWKRESDLEVLANQMIIDNKEQIDLVIHQVIGERVGPHHSCFTDYCGHEFPEFTNKCPNTNKLLPFTEAHIDTYGVSDLKFDKTETFSKCSDTMKTKPLNGKAQIVDYSGSTQYFPQEGLQFFTNTRATECPVTQCNLMKAGCKVKAVSKNISMSSKAPFKISGNTAVKNGYEETLCVQCQNSVSVYNSDNIHFVQKPNLCVTSLEAIPLTAAQRYLEIPYVKTRGQGDAEQFKSSAKDYFKITHQVKCPITRCKIMALGCQTKRVEITTVIGDYHPWPIDGVDNVANGYTDKVCIQCTNDYVTVSQDNMTFKQLAKPIQQIVLNPATKTTAQYQVTDSESTNLVQVANNNQNSATPSSSSGNAASASIPVPKTTPSSSSGNAASANIPQTIAKTAPSTAKGTSSNALLPNPTSSISVTPKPANVAPVQPAKAAAANIALPAKAAAAHIIPVQPAKAPVQAAQIVQPAKAPAANIAPLQPAKTPVPAAHSAPVTPAKSPVVPSAKVAPISPAKTPVPAAKVAPISPAKTPVPAANIAPLQPAKTPVPAAHSAPVTPAKVPVTPANAASVPAAHSAPVIPAKTPVPSAHAAPVKPVNKSVPAANHATPTKKPSPATKPQTKPSGNSKPSKPSKLNTGSGKPSTPKSNSANTKQVAQKKTVHTPPPVYHFNAAKYAQKFPVPGGYDCKLGTQLHGRTCKCVLQDPCGKALTKCRNRYIGTVQSTANWCRSNPVI